MMLYNDPQELELEAKSDELRRESRLYFDWACAYARRCRERSVLMDGKVYDEMCRAWLLFRARYHRSKAQLDLLRYMNLSK